VHERCNREESGEVPGLAGEDEKKKKEKRGWREGEGEGASTSPWQPAATDAAAAIG